MTAMILEDLQARLRSVVRPNENPESLLESLLTSAVDDFIAQREQDQARYRAAEARATAVLGGSFRHYDPQAAYQQYREQFGWTEDLSHLTDEELAASWEMSLAELSPEKIAELEQLGLYEFAE